jgi:hypothetical protein
MDIDANKVIEKLAAQNTQLIVQNMILQTQLEAFIEAKNAGSESPDHEVVTFD